MLDLNQMALFVQVVQAGSFAKAARRLGLPPTTLSRQVAQLEDSLQTRLLHRTTRKLSLTDAGRTLFDRCAAQIESLSEAAAALSEDADTPKGRIRVAAPVGFFDYFQMDWLAEFLARYPAVQVEFMLSDGMADFVGEGIDLAFRGSGELPDSSLVARKLASSYLALAASPSYLATRGTPQTVEDLTGHECILPAKQGPSGSWRLDNGGVITQVQVSGRFAANTGQSQIKAAIAGLGICLQPIGALRNALACGELVQVLSGVASAAAGLYVVCPSRRHVPRTVTAFVDMTLERLAAAVSVRN